MKKFQGGASPIWNYKQPESGMEFQDFAIKGIQRRVFDHRMAVPKLLMDVSPGWELRLENDLCEQNPQAKCVERKAKDGESSPLMKAKSFLAAVWHLKLFGAQLVSDEEMKRRASICAACPKRGDLRTICTACANITKWMTQIVGGKKLLDSDSVCTSCGCPISSKVAFPIETLRKADNRHVDYWEGGCWMLESDVSPNLPANDATD